VAVPGQVGGVPKKRAPRAMSTTRFEMGKNFVH
jgi:hypothetical protein